MPTIVNGTRTEILSVDHRRNCRSGDSDQAGWTL